MRFGTTPSLKKTPDHQHLSPWDQSQPPLIQKAQSSKVGAKRYTHIPTCMHAQTSHSKPGVPKVHTQPPRDYKHHTPSPGLSPEICFPYRRSPYQPLYQNFPYQVPRPC